ncbi:non-ribosomal peptide synthetase, partial [Pseudomonas sp. Leaf127]|uniref:non-ribosomal peptide synthetase n=1 Tax=Pseudomonas sp. Leaf127 TaxID=1736267 RepID=UPI000AA42C5B
LSPMQQGMLFHSLYEQEAGDYINQMRVDVEGLDVESFRRAWQQTVEAHDSLRSAIVLQGDLEHPVQVVYKQVQLPFASHDLSTQADVQAKLDRLATEERQQGFELSQAPLLRLVVVRTGEGRHHLIYTNHHILMDGWSNSRLLGEVLQRYTGQSVALPAGRYRDYIAWLQRQDATASETFWKARLAELEGPVQLVLATRSLTPGESGYGDHHQDFGAASTQKLKAFAQQHKVTVNTLVQSAWLLLLQRYTGHTGVCFGATVAGRPAELAGVEDQIGLFINTLPVIASPRAEQPVRDWIAQVQAQNLQVREYEHTPLYDVQRWAGWGTDGLFDNILVFENYPVAQALQQGSPAGLSFSSTASLEQTHYPLTLTVSLEDALAVHYSYDRQHFDAQAVGQVAVHFCTLLEALIVNAETPIGELSIHSHDTQRQWVDKWSRKPSVYPSERCIHQLIEEQVERTPDDTALLFGDQQLSYRELNRRANRLAHRLIELGAGPDVPVGIAVERGLEMVVGLLGILKAGGAYVPLDPEYPRDRLAYMLENSGARLLLTQAQFRDRLPVPDGIESLEMEASGHWLAEYSEANPHNRTAQQNLAYVMYTSGSTGRPKGVGIQQGSLTRHAWVSIGFFKLTPQDRILQFATFNFDGFVEQLYPALICGASVVIRGKDVWDSDTFYQVLIDKDISVVDLTTAYWFMLAKDFQGKKGRDYGRLRQVHSGGEAMPPEGIAAWKEAGLAHIRLLNTYGPTEATVTVTAHDCQTYLEGSKSLPTLVPIGQVLDGRSIYVLDTVGDIVTQAAIGELVIGGDLLARGYHARPALTAERFIPDPFDEQGGGRLYRSGDLARYFDDGVIEYAGRVDHQVKIRGFRIELGEIEARLQEQAAVRDAVVLAHEGPNGPQLVAYVVPARTVEGADSSSALRETLRGALKSSLPDYMVPAHLMFLDLLPLTPNGKLDRKALPAPEGHVQPHYLAPQSTLEQQIAGLWQDVLKLERVGLTDNFFELGGDSIISLQVVSRARQAGIQFTPKDLFQHQTVQALALV